MLSGDQASGYDVVADKTELAKLGGDSGRFVELLKEKSVLEA